MVTRSRAPLSGLKVIEIGVAMAGPYCGMMLADYGAEVIKVERPGVGDESRQWAPFFHGELSHYFAAVNRNKKSLAVDIKTEAGGEIVRKLATDADVLIENFRPGALERTGLGFDRLHEINPRLIYCSVSGYGASGPMRDERANDVAIQAYAGGMSITGESDRGPVKMAISVADIGAGMFATNGILMALFMRNVTGEGQRVDTSLLEGHIAMLSYHFTAYFASGKIPQRKGSSAQGLVPYQAFEAADGWMVVAVFTDRMWRDLCDVIRRPEWGNDPRFNTPKQRMVNRDEIIMELSKLFLQDTIAGWRGCLTRVGIPCTPILTIDQVAREEQVAAREMIASIEVPGAGEVRMASVPIKFSNAQGGVRSAPPRLGENSLDILKHLGYPHAEVERFIREGIIEA